MKKIPYILIFIAWIIFARPSFAQILIEEGKIHETVKPGNSISNSITVHNTSNESIEVKAYWEDFIYIPPFDGKKTFLPQGSSPLTMSKWVQFSPREFELPPFGKKKLLYSVKVPADAVGGHYGVLFLEKATPGQKDKIGVRIVTRVGSLFFIDSEKKEKKSEILNFQMAKNRYSGEFSNEGNVILIASGIFYIMDPEGLVMDRGELKKKLYTPPGEKAEFSGQFSEDLKEGKYTLVLTFDLEDGDALVKEIDFQKDSSGQTEILQERD